MEMYLASRLVNLLARPMEYCILDEEELSWFLLTSEASTSSKDTLRDFLV